VEARCSADRYEEELRTARRNREWVVLLEPAFTFRSFYIEGVSLPSAQIEASLGPRLRSLSVIPLVRSSRDAASEIGIYTAGIFSAAFGVLDGSNFWAVELRGDVGLALEYVVLGASLRLDATEFPTLSQAEGTLGPFLAIGRPGSTEWRQPTDGQGLPSTDLGFWFEFHWMPDVFGQDSVGNIQIELTLTVLALVFSFRIRYDDQLGGLRQNVVFGASLGAFFDVPSPYF
jgi:hypothetical protein